MRHLTLGVLIVSGGALAALPFRRSSSDREVLDAAVRATGPTVTPLDTSSVEVNFSPATEVHAAATSRPSWMPRNITEPMEGERFIQMPESFSEESPELPKPKVIVERFSASVDFQSDEVAARQAADRESVMMGDLAQSQAGASSVYSADGRYPEARPNPAIGMYARGPLVGGAMSAPVSGSAGNRFGELAVDAGAATSPLPLGARPADSQAAGQPGSRDSFVSSRAVRPATESLGPEGSFGSGQVADPVPPLPPAQAERPKFWIRQPE